MSEFLIAVILGVVEGFTEFLPISSTGHLILINQFISFDKAFTDAFDVIIQLGAILAVLIVFRDRLFPFEKIKKFRFNKIFFNDLLNDEKINLWKKVIIAVIPALFLGAIFGDFIKDKLFNPLTVSIALIVGGVLLIFLEKIKKNVSINNVNNLSYKKAFLIGLFQCLALIPGTSRSASTIISTMFLGGSRLMSAEFSFFLAIPTMFAATAYTLLKTGFYMNYHQLIILAVGFIVSFITALIIIKSFMSYIQNKSFAVFGYYRIVLGLIVLFYIFCGK